jgi:alpha-L-fucosidase 2
MMLQSWDGAIRVFPAWPADINARFDKFRAEGAFLVSSQWQNGNVVNIEIISEKGGVCKIYNPWDEGIIVCDEKGKEIETIIDDSNRMAFNTEIGALYRVNK